MLDFGASIRVNNGLQRFASEKIEQCPRTTRAARVDQDGPAIAWIVDRDFCGELGDGNADGVVWVCFVKVVERQTELCAFKIIEACVELETL
jgi:hypothetical protein